MQISPAAKTKSMIKSLIFIELKMTFVNNFLLFVSYFSNLG
jgi:hypothetical protein